jgi:hypothetical protein
MKDFSSLEISTNISVKLKKWEPSKEVASMAGDDVV